jgi:hypothetical protein
LNVLIGVATADLRNKPNQERNKNSMYIMHGRQLYSDGKKQKNDFKLAVGDKVTVRRSAQQIEWIRSGQSLCSAPIPNHIGSTPLFPVLWIYDND